MPRNLLPHRSHLSRAGAAASVVVGFVDRLTRSVGDLGVGAFGWPLAIGMGIGVGLFGLHEPRFLHGVFKRRATLEFMRPTLSAVALFTVATFFIALAVALVRRRLDGARTLGNEYAGALRRGAFLSSLPLVVVLKEQLEPTRDWLLLAFIATTGALVTYSAYFWIREPRIEGRVMRSLRKPSGAELVTLAVVCLASVVYAAFMARLSISNHLSFNTGKSDLGTYVNVLRESSEGRLLRCSLCQSGRLPRFEPVLLLLAPLYRIHPFAETLLVLQCLWLAAGAPAVYLLAERLISSKSVGVLLALSYLVYPAVHGANLDNFHPLTLAIPLFLWLLYFLERGATRAYLVVLFLLLLVREDMALALAGVGLFAVFSGAREQARLGVFTLAAATLSALAVMAFHGPSPFAPFLELASGPEAPPARAYRRLFNTGILAHGPMLGITRALALDKMDYVAKILVPLLGIPLLPRGRILLAYGALVALLGAAPEVCSLYFEHSAFITPFVFVLGVSGLARLASGARPLGSVSGARLARALALGMLVASVSCSVKFGALAENASFRAGSRPLTRSPSADHVKLALWLRKLSRSFPKGAKVAATSTLLPHLGSVSHLYAIEDRSQADHVIGSMKQRILSKELGGEESHGYLARVDSQGEFRLFRTMYRGFVPPPKKRLDDE
ncbi:MAG TPA: DUF2079 domain-containing protein [Polyangiaceae bacterium]